MVAGWAEKDDQELLALVQEGSQPAFAELVQRHADRFYRLAYRYVQSRDTAEDIVQDAFVNCGRSEEVATEPKLDSPPGFTAS
jgi:DNA-directed RNA polymerase specialized sigma24 family protein